VAALMQREKEIEGLLVKKHFSFQSELAFDSNINNGLANDGVLDASAIFSGLSFTDDFVEHSGFSLKSLASFRYQKQIPEGFVSTDIKVNHRMSEHAASDYSVALLGLNFELPDREKVTTLRSWVASTRYGGESLIGRLGFSVQQATDFNNFFIIPWASVEKQSYASNSALNGMEVRVGIGGVPQQDKSWSYFAGVSQNIAESAKRPGGDQFGINLQMSKIFAAGEGDLNLKADLNYLKDIDFYDNLSGLNQRRHSTSARLQLEYALPLANGWQWFAIADVRKQSSNLELFENQGFSVGAGIKYSF
jgi:hypothetical protein